MRLAATHGMGCLLCPSSADRAEVFCQTSHLSRRVDRPSEGEIAPLHTFSDETPLMSASCGFVFFEGQQRVVQILEDHRGPNFIKHTGPFEDFASLEM